MKSLEKESVSHPEVSEKDESQLTQSVVNFLMQHREELKRAGAEETESVLQDAAHLLEGSDRQLALNVMNFFMQYREELERANLPDTDSVAEDAARLYGRIAERE